MGAAPPGDLHICPSAPRESPSPGHGTTHPFGSRWVAKCEGPSKTLYSRGGPKSKPSRGTGSWAGDLAPSWTHSRPLPTAAGCVVSEALGGQP